MLKASTFFTAHNLQQYDLFLLRSSYIKIPALRWSLSWGGELEKRSSGHSNQSLPGSMSDLSAFHGNKPIRLLNSVWVKPREGHWVSTGDHEYAQQISQLSVHWNFIFIVYKWNIILNGVIDNRSARSTKTQFILKGIWIFKAQVKISFNTRNGDILTWSVALEWKIRGH